MSDTNSKKAPQPKMHIVEILDADKKVIASYAVREVGKLQAKNVILENRVTSRRASEEEIENIARSGTPVLGIQRLAAGSVDHHMV